MLCFTYTTLFSTYKLSWRICYNYYLYFAGEKWWIQKSSDLFNVTQLLGFGTGTQEQGVFSSLCFDNALDK